MKNKVIIGIDLAPNSLRNKVTTFAENIVQITTPIMPQEHNTTNNKLSKANTCG